MYIRINFFTLIFCFLTSVIMLPIGASAKEISLLNSKEIKAMLNQVSEKNLLALNEQGGLDKANEVYGQVINKMVTKIKAKNKITKKQAKIFFKTKEEQRFLVLLIHRTEFFSENISGSLLHFDHLSSLYQVAKKDVLKAIASSKLSNSQQSQMIEALESIVNPQA